MTNFNDSKLELILKIINQDGEAIEVAPGSGHKVKVPYSGKVPEKGLLARYL